MLLLKQTSSVAYLLLHRQLRNLEHLVLTASYSVQVGDKTSDTRKFSQADLDIFSKLSGDTNSIHSSAFSSGSSPFPRPVVHGALMNAFVSGIIGTKLPGEGSLVFSQSLKFVRPLYVETTMSAEVEIVSIKKRFIECSIKCLEEETGKLLISGTATVVFNSRSPCDSKRI